jgi:hypothetical protein
MEAWFERCDHPERVEYIISVHKTRIEEFLRHPPMNPGFGSLVVIRNDGEDTNVSQVNALAAKSTGKLMVGTMDDLFPPDHWDTLLLEAVPELDGEFVVHCSSRSPRDREPLINAGCMTRARYQRYGYLVHPAYESMFADDELTAVAYRDGVVIQRFDIEFDHRHPAHGTAEVDDVYLAENRAESYALGERIFRSRQAQGFPVSLTASTRRRIAIVIPGETFSARWVINTVELFSYALSQADAKLFGGYSSNPSVTRQAISKDLLCENFDFILWIDDDNILSGEQLQVMLATLEAYPEIDMVCGWCLVTQDGYEAQTRKVSAGMFDETGACVCFREKDVVSAKGLIDVQWTGFPAVLMRGSMLRRLGWQAFAHIPAAVEWGFFGEDVSFCKRAMEAGLTIVVDPRLKVPHLKLRDSNLSTSPDVYIRLDGDPVKPDISVEEEEVS